MDLQREKGALPRAAARSSNIGGNVLVFVAVLAVLLVAIYVMNRGKPPEATMFSGAPAPAPAAGGPSPSNTQDHPAAGPPVKGSIELADGVEAPEGAVLFLTARPSGARGGPPLAVRRIEAQSLPTRFSIGAADMMIAGRPWKGPIDISARLDQDGDALSRSPGDLATSEPVRGVELGATKVRVILAVEGGR
ncbi:MAG: hypothetical protein AAGD10_16045 [Myxococcota bacterium]